MLVRSSAAVLLLCAIALAASLSANPLAAQTDVIRGRVTDLEGQPVSGVRVSATSLPGNVTRTATTNQQGNFQIAFPGGPGDYIMGFSHFAYAFRQFQVKRLADEAVLIADARLSAVQLDSIVVVASRQERVNRNQQTPDVSGTERAVGSDALPADLQGDIAALAASLPGVALIPGLDGEPDGFSVLGLDADANSVTLNGVQSSVGSLPRDASVSSSLSTSPFDVSRGGFSGGEFSIRTRPGSNFKNRGMSLVMTAPQMQWTDQAGRALANDYTNISLGGTASGPIKRNSAFYNFSLQLGRQSRDNQTLLTTNALGLQTAGVATDSVSRLVDILARHGVPTAVGRLRDDRVTDNGSLFGSVDFSPPGSAAGHSFNLTLNGNWRRQDPVTSGALAFGSAAGDRTSWGWGAQTRHSGYLGLILSETSAGVDVSQEDSEPYLDLPAGRVRVSSLLEDGASGVQTLTFGGNQGLASSSSSTNATLQNALSWFDDANKHRMKLSTELQLRRSTQHQASNLLGSFTFNSLEDLEAGRPAAFTRTLTARERTIDQWIGSVSLGDSYRRTNDLQFQYGLRLDASDFTTKPQHNALIESTFGRRNDRVPLSLLVSPRVGFSWTLGNAQEVAAFTGAARAPRAVLRGGIGVFGGNAGSGQVGQAIENTGLPGGNQQISCVGPAVPIPNWDAYGDPSAVPDRCADGSTGTVFSTSAPNVTLFGEDYRPSRTIRSNLSWNGSALDGRFSIGVDGTWSLNLNQQRSLDLNFDSTQRFTLADEGRPVFVEPSGIVPSTGTIASRAARLSADFARVTELRSDLRSRTGQLSVRLSPIQRTPTTFGWSASYTFSHIREQVSGFTSTAGDPLLVEWAPSGQGPHQISYTLRYNFFNTVQVSWNGSFRSGNAFTPFVAGDVNGDGYSNDRAFIYDPASAADPTLAAGMRSLLETAPEATRRCLEKQLGRLAERNSCRGPWSSSASLNLTLDRAKFRMPQRGSISFSLSNPLGALDLLVNGSGDLKGWGQTPSPDASLLYVRGFDPATRRYRYEVNERFGATRPQFSTLRSPVTLTASVRIDLGPTRERQNLSQQLSQGRTAAGARFPETLFRSSATGTVLNPMTTILRTQDTLQLSPLQADSIASMNRRYMYQADSIWAPVSRYLAALPNEFEEDAAYDRYLSAREAQVDLLGRIVPAIRALLTEEQRRKLPAQVNSLLDPRYLALIRGGTGMYVSGAGGAVPVGVPAADVITSVSVTAGTATIRIGP
jgi:hypothetical protein